MRRILQAATAIALGTVVLAGCSGGSDGGGSIVDRDEVYGGAAAAPSASPSSAPAAEPGGGTTSQQGSRRAPSLVTGEAKIRTAELSVTVTDRAAVAARADQAATLAERVGGEVESEDRGETYASLRLRVPPAELSSSLRTLSTYGKATSREVSARDVTAQVADVTSRVRSAEQAIARLRALYTSAGRVTDVIAVEQQLTSREADLESLQAQQRSLAKQTSLATISLSLRAASTTPPPKTDDRSGFLGGLERGWNAFVGFLTGLATGLGAGLPFLVLVAVLLVAARIVVIRFRRRRPVPAPAGPQPATD